MVAGQTFDDELVAALAAQADLVVCHNSAFDRKFVEQRYPVFATLPWACTMTQIDWRKEHISSRTLEYLLYKCGGYSINAHRALDDAEGVLGLLLSILPVTEAPIFKTVLDVCGSTTAKITAVGAPYDKKDTLKQRGYRWSDGSGTDSKGWWTSVPEHLEHEELAYLAEEIYPGGRTESVEIKRIDAYGRFSVRE
jgi:DNA polymerase-3 subunit epsilon